MIIIITAMLSNSIQVECENVHLRISVMVKLYENVHIREHSLFVFKAGCTLAVGNLLLFSGCIEGTVYCS